LRIVMLALGYVAAWIALWLVANVWNLTAGVSLWYPPAGLTFAILLECGARALPLPVVAALIAGSTLWSWEQWPYYLMASLAHPLSYLVATRALKNHPGDLRRDGWRFNDPHRVAIFLGIAAVGALFAALTGAGILHAAGMLPPARSWLEIVLGWWVGDFVGVATIAPLGLIVVAPLARRFSEGQPLRRPRAKSSSGPRPTRLALPQMGLSVVLLAAVFWVPNHFFRDGQQHPFAALLLLPVLTWIVATRGMRGTVVTVFLYELAIAALAALLEPAELAFQYQIVMAAVVASGLLTGAVSHARLADITRFRDLAEVSNDLLWEFDAGGHLCNLRGRLPGAVEPRGIQPRANWRDFVIPQEQDTDFAALKAAIGQRQPFRQLVLRLRLPGQERTVWTRNSGMPLLDDDGEVLGYRGTTTDITDHKQAEALREKAEAVMRDYDQTLEAKVEAKVEERTRKLTEASLRNWRLANFDGLTGLPNRNLLFEHLSKGLQQARRQWRLLAVLLVDLDGFKHVNDTLGHDAGDELLRQVAERLRQCVRATDTAARLGGDEFVIVLSDLGHPDAAAAVARKTIARLAEPVPLGPVNPVVTASIGIALYRPELPANLNQAMTLLRQADNAMYAAKRAGKNGWRFADELDVE
jgi:diguanylate cyclase (GGDEF)-like protein